MSKLGDNLYGMDNRLTARAAGGSRSMIPAALLLAYLIAKPFYLFPSGGPQIADGFIGLLFFWSLFSAMKSSRDTAGVFTACIYFSVYALFINGTWALVLGNISMLKTPIFYFFNTITIFIILTFHALVSDKALRILVLGTVLSLVLQVTLS